MRTCPEAAQSKQGAPRFAENPPRMETPNDHDLARAIRTPLNTVVGFAELLHSTSLTAEQREMLDMIQASARDISRLVDERERAVRPVPSPSARPREEPQARRHRPLDVLVVEDQYDNRHLLVRILEWADHRATEAESGAEALDLIQRQEFDVVLMDIDLPDMDGVSATNRIRALERGSGRHVPILAVTASARETDRARCLDAGMDGYLPKPIQARTLLDEIERVARMPQYSIHVAASFRMLDLHAVLANTEGDRKLVATLARILLDRIPSALGEMRDAIAREDGAALRKAASALLGSTAIFAVPAVSDAIEALEQMGRGGRVDVAPAVLAVLETELAQLQPELRALTEHVEG